MKEAPLTSAQQDEFRRELDRVFSPLGSVPPRDRLMPTAAQLAESSPRRFWQQGLGPIEGRITRRNIRQWGLGLGAAAALGVGVISLLNPQPATPSRSLQEAFIAPLSTHMTSSLQNGRVSFTFVMTNRRNYPLTVKPWTQPARLILTPEDGGTPISRVEHFPQSLTIPAHQSRRWTVVVSAPPPGWYNVVTSTVGVHWPGSNTWDRTALGGEWFSPSPGGTLRTGTLIFHQTVRSDGYTVHLRSLAMSDTRAQITFQIDDVPYFPTDYTVYVTEGGRVIDAGSGSQRTPSNKPVTRHATLIGTVTVDPIPKTVRILTVSIAHLGVNGSGSQTVAGPWTFRIRLPKPSKS